MRCVSAVTALVCLCAAALSAARKPVTIEAAAQERRAEAGRDPMGAGFEELRLAGIGQSLVVRHRVQEQEGAAPARRPRKGRLEATAQGGFRLGEPPCAGEKIQWAPDGKGLLLVVNGDLFWLDRRLAQMGAIDRHRHGGARSEALARRAPRLLPPRQRTVRPGARIEEGHPAHQRRNRNGLERTPGLGLPGRARPGHGALVVARFVEDRLSAI